MTEDWKKRIKDLEAMHDAQRRDLQARNTELVEQRRKLTLELDEARAKLLYAERIVAALAPDPSKDGYFLPRVWVLATDPLTRRYFETVL